MASIEDYLPLRSFKYKHSTILPLTEIGANFDNRARLRTFENAGM